MTGLLVRVGIDQTYGGWNAPVNPQTGEFVFVPIPDGKQRRGLHTPYSDFTHELGLFPGLSLPSPLVGRPMHLDPDFEHLTYGDTGDRRGRSLAGLAPGDFIAFYSGLRPTARWQDPLLYALIGLYRVRECVRLPDVPRTRWHENAHTRRAAPCANNA
jgi:Nucleotide modification associated domain 3